MKRSRKRFAAAKCTTIAVGTDSERNVAVLFARVGVSLDFQRAESGDDAWARFGWLDDGVNVAFFCGDEGVSEAVAKFVYFFLAEPFAVGFGGFV
jgi:hypothetical protein